MVGVYRRWFFLLYVLSLRQSWISYSGGSNADDLCTGRPWSHTGRRSQLCKFRYACSLLSHCLSSKLPRSSVRPHIADFASTFWPLPLCVSQFHPLPGGGVLLSVEFWIFVCCQWNFYLLRCSVANMKPFFSKSLAGLGHVCRGIKFFSGFL